LHNIDKGQLNRVEQLVNSTTTKPYRPILLKAHYMPLTSGSSFHSVLAFLPRTSRFKTLMHYQTILRLEQFPIYFVEQINWMSKSNALALYNLQWC
jgi:hypothetical protein